MLYHQLKISLRSLWKGRLFTFLHVAGLSIGLSAAWIIWQYADFEYSHNRQIPNAENIYRVVSYHVGVDNEQSANAGCPKPMWEAAEGLAGVKSAVPIQSFFALSVMPEGTRHGFREVREIAFTIPSYFDIVPLQWLAGSEATALTKPDQVVLARSRAEKYFPRHAPEEMLGKIIQYESFSDTIRAQVAGVVEDLTFPSSFIEKELLTALRSEDDRWNSVSSNNQLWLVLGEGSDPALIGQSLNDISQRNSAESLNQFGLKRSHELQPLTKVHFAERFASHVRTANASVLRILLAIAVFLLLLACINYINLSTAQIPGRAREIGIRKTLGGRSKGIMGSFLLETVIICLLAAYLAGVLTHFAFDYLKNDLPEDVLKYANWQKTGLFLTLLVVAVSLLSGLYPGWLITRFQAVSLLRGQFSGQHQSNGHRGGNLRRGLIVFQFFIAQVFIIGALVVGQQLHFMRNSDLGFDQQAVVTLEKPLNAHRDPALNAKFPVLATTYRQMPDIQQAAFGDPLLSNSYSSNTHFYTDANGNKKEAEIYRKNADAELMDLYKLPLVAGRKLIASDSMDQYVINEAAVRAFGFESAASAVGQIIAENVGEDDPPRQKQIVGVVADFHSMGFSEIIRPTALIPDPEHLSTMNIRLASTHPSDWQVTLKKMEAAWQEVFPGEPFNARFYDETLADIYEADLTMSRFINLATAIAIFISCLGLFGLATFMAWRRTKEIGIRKVLGASLASVVGLLSKEFLVLTLAGFLLAVPIAYYFLQKWLNDYVYRIELTWWMFVAAGLGAMLVAFLTVSYQSVKAAISNPVESLRSE